MTKTLEERIKEQVSKSLEIRATITTIVFNDIGTQESIESIIDEQYPKLGYRMREEPNKKEESDLINTIINEFIYRKVDLVLMLHTEIKDLVNDTKANHLKLVKGSLMKIQAIFSDEKKSKDQKHLPIKRGKGRPFPNWLLGLKKGQYTVDEIVEISKTERRNVQKTMKKYCKNISYIDVGDFTKKCVYHWDGFSS